MLVSLFDDEVSNSLNSSLEALLDEEHAYATSPGPLWSRLSVEQVRPLLHTLVELANLAATVWGNGDSAYLQYTHPVSTLHTVVSFTRSWQHSFST